MIQQQEEHDSLVHVKANDAFRKKPIMKDDESLQVSYPQLCGEYVEYLAKACDAIISLSNFRVLIRYTDSFDNVPLRLIESVECRDLVFLHILCKDAQSIRCKFSTNEKCQLWTRRINKAIRPPSKLEDLFAFPFHAWCFNEDPCELSDRPTPGLNFFRQQKNNDPAFHFILDAEAERMQFDLRNTWQICTMNRDFSLCPSYPKKHIIPTSISDEELKTVANFRSNKRFPSVVWRNKANGAVIVRCSQPEVGWLGWRSSEDEAMLQAILEACKVDSGGHSMHISMEEDGGGGGSGIKDNDVAIADSSDSSDCDSVSGVDSLDEKKILLLDARSYTAAVANRAKGGGCECSEYYPCCEIQFMSLPNIHSVRKTFHSVRNICSSSENQPNWLSSLENTKWLHHLSMLLSSAVVIVNAVDKEKRPVVVHCSDGWDRTPQLTALSQLLLDPYYRTLQGFQVLVEREWLDFGHKFADRCGHAKNDDVNERCPVFLQWLDSVHQILKQFPTAFQFNETFLVKLVKHTFSSLFGTFLCNSPMEREKHDVKGRTCSVWSILEVEGHKYKNFLYAPVLTNKVLYPSCNIRNLHIWANVYMSDYVVTSPDDMTPTGPAPHVQMTDTSQLPRTKSCDDIHKTTNELSEGKDASKETATLQRTSSDPNLSDTRADLNIGVSAPRRGSDISPETLRKNISSLELDMVSETVAETCVERVVQNDPYLTELTNGVITSNGFHENDMDRSKAFYNVSHNGHLSNGLSNGIANIKPDIDESITTDSSTISTPLKTLKTSVDAHLESSTETLTEEAVNSQEHESKYNACLSNHHSNEKRVLGHNGFERSRSLETTSTISTSTTDISESNIVLRDSLQRAFSIQSPDYDKDMFSKSEIYYKPHQPLSIKTCKSYHEANYNSHARNLSGSSVFSSTSEYSTPSASPRCELNGHGGSLDNHKSCTLSEAPNMLRIGRHLDEDGLTTIKDPFQNQILVMQAQHKQEIEHYKRQMKLLWHNTHHNYQYGKGLEREFVCGDLHTDTSNCNSIKSDVSWEEIDEEDGIPVLWVPDHAANECALCQAKFQLWNRKHHCRACGKVFCGTCSNYSSAIPEEQLFKHVRVCQTCHSKLESSSHMFRINQSKTAITTASG